MTPTADNAHMSMSFFLITVCCWRIGTDRANPTVTSGNPRRTEIGRRRHGGAVRGHRGQTPSLWVTNPRVQLVNQRLAEDEDHLPADTDRRNGRPTARLCEW